MKDSKRRKAEKRGRKRGLEKTIPEGKQSRGDPEPPPYLLPGDAAKAESAILLYNFQKMIMGRTYRRAWTQRYGEPNDGNLVR
jgi:hypothetical protein